MKKIIALILVVGCLLAMSSCSLFNKKQDHTGISAVQSAIDSSAPKSADINVEFDSTLGKLEGEYDVVYNEDGTATVDYTYEKFNNFSADTAVRDEIKSSYTGTVVVAADGSISSGLDGVASVEAVTFELNLNPDKLVSYEAGSSVLNAKVAAANTASVIGVAINADVDLVITVGANRVTSVVMTYALTNGTVTITAIYHY